VISSDPVTQRWRSATLPASTSSQSRVRAAPQKMDDW
jgi:hypothetical protein